MNWRVQPVADLALDLPELDKPGGLARLLPGFKAECKMLTAKLAANAPLKRVASSRVRGGT